MRTGIGRSRHERLFRPSPTADEQLVERNEALRKIAWILATPDWSVGMLDDIAEIVTNAGFVAEPHDGYIHH